MTPVGTSYEYEGKLVEIGLAKEFKDNVLGSGVIEFSDQELRRKLMNMPKEQLVVITSKIDSPKKILSVDVYGDDYIEKAFS